MKSFFLRFFFCVRQYVALRPVLAFHTELKIVSAFMPIMSRLKSILWRFICSWLNYRMLLGVPARGWNKLLGWFRIRLHRLRQGRLWKIAESPITFRKRCHNATRIRAIYSLLTAKLSSS